MKLNYLLIPASTNSTNSIHVRKQMTFPAEATAANTVSASAREIRTRTPVDLQHHYQLASPPPVVVATTLCNGLTLYAVPLSFTNTGCESRPGSSYEKRHRHCLDCSPMTNEAAVLSQRGLRMGGPNQLRWSKIAIEQLPIDVMQRVKIKQTRG
jgi:hypothetical protein